MQVDQFKERMEELHNMFIRPQMIRNEYIYFVLPQQEGQESFITQLTGLSSMFRGGEKKSIRAENVAAGVTPGLDAGSESSSNLGTDSSMKDMSIMSSAHS